MSASPAKLSLCPTIKFPWELTLCGLQEYSTHICKLKGYYNRAGRENLGLEEAKKKLPKRKKNRGSHQLPPAGRQALSLPGPVPLVTPSKEPWQGRLWASAFPTFSSLSRKAFCKSFNHAHIFSHDRVLADGDLHPTITDEICIDSKIKSNEKKIGSQPDPTVPDCCIEVTKRHFFIVSRFQLTTSSHPILPLLVWTEDQILEVSLN